MPSTSAALGARTACVARSGLAAATLSGLVVFAAACKGPRIAPRPATPQRPTISSNTNTTAEHTFELETGAAIDPGNSFTMPNTLKWGQGERTEFFVGWSPVAIADLPGGETGASTGDVVLGTRHRLLDERDGFPSLAYQLDVKLPSADPGEGTGSGEVDGFAALIATKTVGRVSGTAFYQFGVVGDPSTNGDTDILQTLSLVVDAAIYDRSTVFAELTGQYLPAQDLASAFLISGGTFEVREDFVLDAAILLGLSDDAPNFQILFGATKNFGALGTLLDRTFENP
jgi:hypothetical protein